jgi:ankyrin repeat protein
MSDDLQRTVETIYKQSIEAAFGRGMYRLVLRAELNTIVHHKSSDFPADGMGNQEGRKESIVHVLSCNIQHSNHFVLHRLAAIEGHCEVVQSLLSHGADVNMRDADGRSTLYVLALGNRLAVARFLLEEGRADIESRDSEVG